MSKTVIGAVALTLVSGGSALTAHVTGAFVSNVDSEKKEPLVGGFENSPVVLENVSAPSDEDSQESDDLVSAPNNSPSVSFVSDDGGVSDVSKPTFPARPKHLNNLGYGSVRSSSTVSRRTVVMPSPRVSVSSGYEFSLTSSVEAMRKERQERGILGDGNVLSYSGSWTALLNADPTFIEDSKFVDAWGKKWDYLVTQKDNNLVQGNVFSTVSTTDKVAGYKYLSTLCWDAYVGSKGMTRNGQASHWSLPIAAQKSNLVNVYGKQQSHIGAYWQAVWRFCTKPDLNTVQLVPTDWGTQVFSR
ncbi:hypothetical protein [Candidatus Mycoplasma haematohominis]|uniref:hypothetical protein n=1 Tax=Candidatus Mycoplasma haematohominis TaxID=1494318 RepID=UPI001C0A6964|nr:hypothetical protein [Candidatus Mycoplasma haemohominis]